MTIAVHSPSPLPILWRWKNEIKFIAISLIFLGTLSIAFQICAVVINGKYSNVGAGIWCGILYAITSALGMFAVHRDNKAMAIGLLWMAVASILTSVALITLAILSLASENTGFTQKNTKWWNASNAILVSVGVLGLVFSTALTTVVGLSISKQKKPKILIHNHPLSSTSETIQSEPTENDSPIEEVKLNTKELLVTVYPQLESTNNSIASSGIYETIPSKQGSIAESINQGEPADVPRPEPIYAIPNKKKKSSTHSNSNGDFEIQIDDRQVSENKTESNGHWFNMERAEEPVGSDVDDSQYTKNIELPKEDVVVHAPPPDTRSPVL